MRPVYFTISGASGASPVFPVNTYISPTNLALGATVTSTITYTVQYTFDDVFAANYVASSGNWVNHPSLTAQTATKDANIAYPVTGVRIISTAGSGSVTLTIIEAGGGIG
jgi:hypothetical protein